VSQHAGLSVERWAGFSSDQQILMIANEMHRASGLLGWDDLGRVRTSYERVLHLVDLTVQVRRDKSFVRELLRWRELVAELYLAERPRIEIHRQLLRCLLYFTPVAARQIRELERG
jgi:hypothetical protein